MPHQRENHQIILLDDCNGGRGNLGIHVSIFVSLIHFPSLLKRVFENEMSVYSLERPVVTSC